MMRLATLITAFAIACPAAAADRSIAEVAAQAAADLSQAAIALENADLKRDRVAALTETVRAYETGLSALREGLRRGAIRARSLQAEFEAEDEKLAQLMGVLLAMQSSPEALLLLHPSGPTETARAGMLVSSVAPGLQLQVDDLALRIEELRQLQALQRDAAEILTAGLEGMQAARTSLSQAIADRADLPKRVASDPAAMQSLINGAETLDAFAGGLAMMTPDGAIESDMSFSSVQGVLPLPVDGVVLRSFGEADAAGVSRPGLVVGTRPEALVTAPWPATIRYAGPLLDYGNVIILEPENGYLLVFAGLSLLYVQAGQVIDASAPLGLMGGETPDAGRILVETAGGGGQDRTETLYIELRQDQVPQDPAEWFIAAAEIGSTE
jgi:septal ring factor EnvC (AmiA/AmiB activator)